MAKGNLFLGTASKSVGDITLMRRNGQQVARVRVRKIANPKSAGQVRQRMMLAAVSRFYAPLSSCLEQSFEGLTKAQSYSKFLQTNMRLARAYGVAVPKDAGFIPLPFRVSSGTMPSANYYYNSADDAGFILDLGGNLERDTYTVAAISQALIARYGLEEGDQVTFIWSLQDGEPDTGGEHVYNVQYRRLWIDTTDTTVLSLGTLSFLSTGGNLVINEDNDWLRGFAVIFSHWENGQWRRSNQLMAVAAGIDEDYMGEEAFKRYFPEWTRADVQPSSDVYLNGAPASAGGLTFTAYGLTWVEPEPGGGGTAHAEVDYDTVYKVVGLRLTGDTADDVAMLVCDDGVERRLMEMSERSDQYLKQLSGRRGGTSSSFTVNSNVTSAATAAVCVGIETAQGGGEDPAWFERYLSFFAQYGYNVFNMLYAY